MVLNSYQTRLVVAEPPKVNILVQTVLILLQSSVKETDKVELGDHLEMSGSQVRVCVFVCVSVFVCVCTTCDVLENLSVRRR